MTEIAHLVDPLDDDCLDAGPEPLHRARRERGVHQAAEVGVRGRIGEDRPQSEHPTERLDLGGMLPIRPMTDKRGDAVRRKPRIIETRFDVGVAREHHAAEDRTPMQRLLFAELAKHG